jgi:hypothetical protein
MASDQSAASYHHDRHPEGGRVMVHTKRSARTMASAKKVKRACLVNLVFGQLATKVNSQAFLCIDGVLPMAPDINKRGKRSWLALTSHMSPEKEKLSSFETLVVRRIGAIHGCC